MSEESEKEPTPLESFNRSQVLAIRSFRRKMERQQHCHLSNEVAAEHWIDDQLAKYFREHYTANQNK